MNGHFLFVDESQENDVRREHDDAGQGDYMRDYYEIYGTIYNKNRGQEHMTVNVWGNTEEEALEKAKIMIQNVIHAGDESVRITCQISDMFPHTLEEFVYKALRENHTGKKKRQGVITLKDMNVYLQEKYEIKNNYAKEIVAAIIMEKDADRAVAYFKNFLGIRAEMFTGKFEVTEKQLWDYEREGRLEFAYEEVYGRKKIKYYKPDAYYQENI